VHPEKGFFDDVIVDPLPGRAAKPRQAGLTMVIDKGLGLSETEGILLTAHAYVDYWKLPFGTPALYGRGYLSQKVALLRRFGLDVYPGGTFLEVAVLQGRVEPFLDRCREVGFTAVEVSDGTIPLDPRERRRIIREARNRGFRVVTEIGKKEAHLRLTHAQIHRAIEEDLAAGAERIIVEGRESGVAVGVYDEAGAIQEDELAKILSGVKDPATLIWEAPQKSQQEDFILRFGPNVNLGNIPPGELLALEALRRGLRGDTLKACLPKAAGEAR
jgi:phosphosulfolactate synthase